MLTRRELENAIRKCEDSQTSYQNCEKLATFYVIYDHLYGDKTPNYTEEVIGSHGESDFLESINGKDASTVWAVMNELMDTLFVVNPRLYDNVMKKVK